MEKIIHLDASPIDSCRYVNSNTEVTHAGKVLKRLREKQGLTARGLAEKAGMNHQPIIQAEGERLPRMRQDKLIQVLKALGVSFDDYMLRVGVAWNDTPEDEFRLAVARELKGIDKFTCAVLLVAMRRVSRDQFEPEYLSILDSLERFVTTQTGPIAPEFLDQTDSKEN